MPNRMNKPFFYGKTDVLGGKLREERVEPMIANSRWSMNKAITHSMTAEKCRNKKINMLRFLPDASFSAIAWRSSGSSRGTGLPFLGIVRGDCKSVVYLDGGA